MPRHCKARIFASCHVWKEDRHVLRINISAPWGHAPSAQEHRGECVQLEHGICGGKESLNSDVTDGREGSRVVAVETSPGTFVLQAGFVGST